MLDIGCGSGWSTSMFRQAGHRAFGLDLHAARLDAAVAYVAADAQRLPFRDGISMRWRCIRCSSILAIRPGARRVLARNRSGRTADCSWPEPAIGGGGGEVCADVDNRFDSRARQVDEANPATPRHPFGNNLPEHWRFVFHHLWHTGVKLAGVGGVRFLMREPDPNPPFHADNDATYYCIRWICCCGRGGHRAYAPCDGGTIIAERRTCYGRQRRNLGRAGESALVNRGAQPRLHRLSKR